MPTPPLILLAFLSLLVTACTPSHLYVSPPEGPTAFLQEKGSVYEDRQGESLKESYGITGIDGKTVRYNWKSAAIDGQYHLLPGSHKIIAMAIIRRGSILNGSNRYYGVLNGAFAENRYYFVNGATRFADNRLDVWLEDRDSGDKVSEVLSLDLSQPVQQPNVVTYPIYIPVTR
jgi:hypothetical protein